MLAYIKYYLSIYSKFVSTSMAEAMTYRLHFVLLILMDAVFYASTVFSVIFIYDHTPLIGPWNKEQLLFFISFVLMLDQIHMAILSTNFWHLAHNIKKGDLDFVFLKPAHSIFIIFFRFMRPSSILTCALTSGIMIYFGHQANLDWIGWVLIPILLILSLTLFAIIEFILCASMFWMTEGIGVNFLRMQLQNVMRWPDFIYGYLPRKVFTFGIPILLITSGPVNFIYDHSRFDYLLGMIAAIFMAAIILKVVWSRALKQYESASS